MAALTSAYVATSPEGALPSLSLPLAAGQKCYENGIACFDSANLGGVRRASVATTLTPIGSFLESVDNSAGGSAVMVGVKLNREIKLRYYDSVSGGGAVTAAAIGGNCYLASDHEVTVTATGASVAGRVWIVRADGKIGVEFPF